MQPFEEQAKAQKVEKSAARSAYEASIPKPPATPFFLFSNEKRVEVMAALPAEAKTAREKMAATGKRLGELWKALPESDKKRYADQYAAEKEKFEAAKDKYIAAQLALLPAEFREMVRTQLPGRVGDVAAWVGRVRELLEREASKDAVVTKA